MVQERFTGSIRKEGYLTENHRFFHLKDTAGQERDYHFHEFDKIVILLSGKVDYAVESDVYSLQPWDILLIRHHTIHKALIDKTVPYERIIIYLNEAYYAAVMPGAELMHCFEISDQKNRRLLKPNDIHIKAIRDILHQYETFPQSLTSSREFIKETFLLQLLILLGDTSSQNRTGSQKKYTDKVESALSYINENLAGDLSVDAIASAAYLSRYHFMRIFREATGTTVHAYIRQRRLLNASRLIREGIPATVAAQQSGFEDYTSFYRAFRESFGINPSQLKR